MGDLSKQEWVDVNFLSNNSSVLVSGLWISLRVKSWTSSLVVLWLDGSHWLFYIARAIGYKSSLMRDGCVNLYTF
jgi:hypothetical protein